MPILKLKRPLKFKITKFVKIEEKKGKNGFLNALSESENAYLCFPVFTFHIVLFHYQKTLHNGM